MKTLLLEIGTEEIPAGYITPALQALSQTIAQKLDQARIPFEATRVWATPRRLAVTVDGVALRQKPETTDVIGPPARIGFDAQGLPTVAAEKFAAKVGVPLSRLQTRTTAKGEYLCACKTDRGRSSKVLLQRILPESILATPFPKKMRWGDQKIEFARPIHWIAALLGTEVVGFTLGSLRSGRYTYGHAFTHPRRIKLTDANVYSTVLAEAGVVVDVETRKKRIEAGITALAEKFGGAVLPDDGLLDIVTHLVEYPAPVLGRFEAAFLSLPREVLITAMREHQKYFAVVDGNGRLMPGFVAVNNTPVTKPDLVAKGHARVLRARLKDAQFFYDCDLRESFENWIERLKGVLFQAKLGTLHDKVNRIEQLAGSIAAAAGMDDGGQRIVRRAARLCKADLVSQMVVEFPKLQGVMGRIYAAEAGESEAVAAAVEEHYRPLYSGGPLPASQSGAVLALADKLDSICGCFQVGLAPSGAADPYALRRQGIGIVQIMRAQGFEFSLRSMIEQALKPYAAEHDDGLIDDIRRFFADRMSHLLQEAGFAKDVVSAVLAAGSDRVPETWQRVEALQALKKAPDFEPIAAAFKRVVNIIRQSGQKYTGVAVAPEGFQEPCENNLWDAFQQVRQSVARDIRKGAYSEALTAMAALRDPVDAFFDGVLVMAEDDRLRANRLAVLEEIASLFNGFADFSKLAT